ncbi:MAG: TIGR02281 family clan AA aspartic protease [Alphaproteobacteria bacterium]|nr:TIGR02281 family clan AA aspartic protease [Alphaproteobacteria bacterium]MDP6515791.1 TIGR02281 family clan AA aspartic protease [Alphaproteobacteria bacterium]
MTRRLPWWVWLVGAGAVLAAVLIWLDRRFPDVLSERDSQVNLVRALFVLGLVGGSVILHRRFKAHKALKYLAIWVLIGVALLLVYSFRHEADDLARRLAGELVPSAGTVAGGAVRFPASLGGHFMVEADVDGVAVRFMVDTGATDVVLSPADARRLGYDLDRLSFTRVYRTANGQVRGAPVRLGRVSIGPIVVDDVRASVNSAAMERSLLGMSFLNRLGEYTVSDDTLTLRP